MGGNDAIHLIFTSPPPAPTSKTNLSLNPQTFSLTTKHFEHARRQLADRRVVLKKVSGHKFLVDFSSKGYLLAFERRADVLQVVSYTEVAHQVTIAEIVAPVLSVPPQVLS